MRSLSRSGRGVRGHRRVHRGLYRLPAFARAARVYCIDAGHGQLHPRLRADERVRCAEGVNARLLTPGDAGRTGAVRQEPGREPVCGESGRRGDGRILHLRTLILRRWRVYCYRADSDKPCQAAV